MSGVIPRILPDKLDYCHIARQRFGYETYQGKKGLTAALTDQHARSAPDLAAAAMAYDPPLHMPSTHLRDYYGHRTKSPSLAPPTAMPAPSSLADGTRGDWHYNHLVDFDRLAGHHTQ